MEQVILVIYDKKSKIYDMPFTVEHEEQARRALRRTLADPKNIYSGNESDFELVKLGTYNRTTGEIKPEKQTLINLKFLCEKKENLQTKK